MKKELLSRPPMLQAAQNGKGHHWAIEILIFLLVFLIAQILQTVFLAIGTTVLLFNSEETLSALIHTMQIGDTAAYTDVVNQFLADNATITALLQLFSTVLSIVCVIFYCRKLEKRSFFSMGLGKQNALREYGIGALIGILLISVSFGICCLTGAMKPQFSAFSPVLWVLFLLGFLIQGMSEEILCRGYLMISLTRRSSLLLAIMTNSLVFGLLHIANAGFGVIPLVNILLFGIFASVWAIKRGNLWGVCAIHSLWNFVQGNLFGISVSGLSLGTSPISTTSVAGQEWLNGGAFGIEGGLAVTLVLVVAIAIALFLMPPKKEADEP